MKLRRFNQEGLRQFEQWLDQLCVASTSVVPTTLLTDASCTHPVAPEPILEPRVFANRMEVARYLDSILETVSGCNVERDAGLWAWLSLFYFDQVCPADRSGGRFPGERARYTPAVDDYKKYYRHLLAGPYRVFRAHRSDPTKALILLCGPIHKPGEIVEQLLARQEIITNPNAIELATRIYFDNQTGSFKRGAAGKGGGSARRFADVLNQFDVTWDLYALPASGISEKLPREFDRFR